MKVWGGRFEKGTDQRVEKFTTSFERDCRMWEVDIRASQAHVRMLGRVGILSEDEASQINEGLTAVASDILSGRTQFQSSAEDIHSEVERLLTERIGPLAGKLHTARSRNDQVATDTRLYVRERVDFLMASLKAVQEWLLREAETNTETLMPGLTHMQHAQPVSLAHHLLAYFWMFQRDCERLRDLRQRLNQCPLGSAALAGTGFAIDRLQAAQELGFEGICENSLDAVSDRDFVVEFLSAGSLIMMHLSRFAEELVLWSAPEYGFVELDDSVTTGSSIMPQKKNPDVAELIRGRVGRVYGNLMGMLTTLKALPLAYNRDLQEDKEHLFPALDTVETCVEMLGLMLESAVFKKELMAQALAGDFSNATDLADFLVSKGMPFRQAHEVIGKIVSSCLKSGERLEDLSLDSLKKHSELFTSVALDLLPHLAVMKARTSRGGTGPTAVLEQLQKAKRLLMASEP